MKLGNKLKPLDAWILLWIPFESPLGYNML